MIVSTSFTDPGVSAQLSLKPGEGATYSVSGTFTGVVNLEVSSSPTTAFQVLVAGVADTAMSGSLKNETTSSRWFRFRAASLSAGTAVTTLTESADVLRTNAVELVTEDGLVLTGTLTVTGQQLTSLGVGAKAGSTVTATEYGNGIVHQTVLTLAATPITLTDDAGAGQYGGVKLYDFPAGNIFVVGAVIDADILLLTPFIDTAEGDIGLGTTAVTDGNALATTEQNIIITTAIAAMVAKAGPVNAQSADVATLAAAGTTDSDLYLNLRIDDNVAHATTPGNTITGTVTITWLNLGDF